MILDERLEWIGREKLIQAHDMVLVGVSGGADSVCLLLLLLELRKKTDFSLRVIHVEHGIRGAESEADADFVKALCQKYGVPCRVFHEKVPEYAKRAGIGLEEAARILRYRCFQKEVDELAAQREAALPIKIALAHHANDNAETILFQMLRGSGLRGLCGMRSRRAFGEKALIIRPLLHISREEIEGYLKEQKQDFRVDGTNQDTGYSRNRIRRNVMPELLKINSQAVRHIAESGAMLQELSDYLDVQVQELMSIFCCTVGNDTWEESLQKGNIRGGDLYGESSRKKDFQWKAFREEAFQEEAFQGDAFRRESFQGKCIQIDGNLFEKYPSLLQREVILQVLGLVAGSRKDIGAVHVEAVQKLASRQVGRSITLPYGLCAIRNYGGIEILRRAEYENCGKYEVTSVECKREEIASESGEYEITSGECKREKMSSENREYEISSEEFQRLEQGEKLTISLPETRIELKILDFGGKIPEIHKKKYTKWLNYDKIKHSLKIRKRAAGDYLVIDEKGHKKKLKEYFVEEKIPSWQRTDIWLLTEYSHVLWVIGGRISADCKIEKSTERVLEVRVVGGNYHED